MRKYKLIYAESALKELSKLDKQVARNIKTWVDKNLIDIEDPRIHGKALTGNYKQYWRYRVGDYRLLAIIRDKELVIIAVHIRHRKDAYKQLKNV